MTLSGGRHFALRIAPGTEGGARSGAAAPGRGELVRAAQHFEEGSPA